MYCTRRRCIFTLVSRTNIDIDETLIEIAMRKYGVHTKTEAVDRALREVAFQPMSTAEILALRGTGFLDAPADQSPRTILVDTSAWVEFSRGTGSAVDEQLSTLIQDRPDEIASTEPVHGNCWRAGPDIRPGDRATSAVIRMVGVRPRGDFAGAARVYRLCRAAA